MTAAPDLGAALQKRLASPEPETESVGFRAELWDPARKACWLMDCEVKLRGGAIVDISFGEGWRRITDLCRVPDAWAEQWLLAEVARQALAKWRL